MKAQGTINPSLEEEELNLAEALKKYGSLTYWNRGVSMKPLIRQEKDHFLILPKTDARCRRFDVVLYRRKNGDYVLHRVMKVREKDYGIRGDNTYKMEYGVTDDQILGVMSAFSRNGGPWISVDDWRCRVYVRIWSAIYPLRWTYVKARRLAARLVRKLSS